MKSSLMTFAQEAEHAAEAAAVNPWVLGGITLGIALLLLLLTYGFRNIHTRH
ncbi:hypothetical protein [Georgenia subflava]|uniref:hypothetical protein n=1 Tax=Georgenia subflava TaxID=1622177 RepID=UPI00186ADAFE|nr:hypothetical protein [Georgenia subflava]